MGDFGQFCERVSLRVEPFQTRIARGIAGPEREFVALLPRGQGKTTLLAAIALHHLVTIPDAQVYCAASSRDQARILYESAAGFARILDDDHLVARHLELRWCEHPAEPKVFSRYMRVLAADAMRLHGLTPTLAIIDELHAHPDDSVYLAMRTAMLKRPTSKLIVISTAGAGVDSPLGRLRARALAQPKVSRRGAVTDARGPNLRFLEWSVDEDADIDDPNVVKQANPASWITADGLREQREAVPDIAFRRFHANMWTEAENHWLPAGAWQACIGTPALTPGEDIWIGVDVGGERSATAVVWANANLHVGVVIYHGDAGLLEAVDQVRDLAARFNVREVLFDPWRFSQAGLELEREGITVTAFPQSDVRMMPASDRLYRAIIERRLVLPDHAELRQHAAAAIARHSRRGWRIDRPDRTTNVDGVVALAMAVEAIENKPADVELVAWL